MQPWSPSVQTPSTFQSMSQASPSAHVSLMPVRSVQATKQLVADGPPPATEPDDLRKRRCSLRLNDQRRGRYHGGSGEGNHEAQDRQTAPRLANPGPLP